MAQSFVGDIAGFAVGLGQLRQSCPSASGHVSKEEARQVLAEIRKAKSFVQTRGAQGTLLGLKNCNTLKMLRKESIPLTPNGFLNWLTAAEQQLAAPNNAASANVPYAPNNSPRTNSNEVSFWDEVWLNVGDVQITTSKALVGGAFFYLLYKEGYLRYKTRSL